jgi:hypothetical protein
LRSSRAVPFGPAAARRRRKWPTNQVERQIDGNGHETAYERNVLEQIEGITDPELMFFGIIAALLYERTGSLLPGIALHSFVDSTGFMTALTGDSKVVVSAFGLLALALLARPPLMSLIRMSRGRPAFRDYTVA